MPHGQDIFRDDFFDQSFLVTMSADTDTLGDGKVTYTTHYVSYATEVNVNTISWWLSQGGTVVTNHETLLSATQTHTYT